MSKPPKLLKDIIKYYEGHGHERWDDVGPMGIADALTNMGQGYAARAFTDAELKAIASLVNQTFREAEK